jgi:hypothetical protein
LWGNLRETDHLEDTGLDGRIILRWIFRKRDRGGGGTDWIDLAMDRDRWWTFVNAIKKTFGFHKMRGIS